MVTIKDIFNVSLFGTMIIILIILVYFITIEHPKFLDAFQKCDLKILCEYNIVNDPICETYNQNKTELVNNISI